MNYLFFSCPNLHDISKWNTHNVTDMRCMFHKCSLLTSLPDISKWNTENLDDFFGMDHMFDNQILDIPNKFQ